MPTGHDYGKTRAFSATCSACERETRGLSTDGRVKTIVRSCPIPGRKARGLILTRDKPKDGPLYRTRPSEVVAFLPFEVFNFLSNAVVALAREKVVAENLASALTGQPPSRYGRTR